MIDEVHPSCELLSDLADRISFTAEQWGFEDADAEEFGQAIIDQIAINWGGQSIYIPMNVIARLDKRNYQIFEEFDGDNIRELCKKYSMSKMSIYRILKKERARRSKIPQHAPRKETEAKNF